MIRAKIILDSISQNGVRITTWELEYPRFIHSELMTHRVFSRNSASSRAIPIERMIQTIRDNPAAPIHWGKNQAGMQANTELEGDDLELAQHLWKQAMEAATHFSEQMAAAGVHKQIANRVTEPYQHMKVVMTTTEHNNWFWLRAHKDAQPEIGGHIEGLARKMQTAFNESVPQILSDNQWHLPFVFVEYWDSAVGFLAFPTNSKCVQVFYDEQENKITLEQAQMISASCCAQVSFRRNDGSLEKAEVIYKRLIESEPCHASPVEHQAMAFSGKNYLSCAWKDLPVGVTHIDRDMNFWSGNFREWIQLRQLIPNNVKRG